MKYRRIESSHLSRSPSSSLPYKLSRIPDDRSEQLMNDRLVVRGFLLYLNHSHRFKAGALSPLHTRRGPLNDLVTPTPDFAEFDCVRECPKLLAVTSDGDCQNVAVAFSDLDKLQIELEQILVHTTDHQKKIYGEITFLTTGDYPSDDISIRLMPVYELKTSEPLPSCSKEIEREPIVEDSCMDGEINWLDEGFDVWPPVNLSQKFWVFAREYLDPVDEEYLHQWWLSIVQLFKNDSVSKLQSGLCPVTAKKSNCCDAVLHDGKASSLPSFSKWCAPASLHWNKSFIVSKNIASPARLKLFNSDSSPPPNKIARFEKKPSSQSPRKTTSLLNDLISAYVSERIGNLGNHYNGVLPKLDKKSCPPKKDSFSLVQLETNDWLIKNEGAEREDAFPVAHLNGLNYGGNVAANCGDTLEMLNCALADYLRRFDEEPDVNKCSKVIQEIGPEGVEELVRKSPSGKKDYSEDEVSAALKKLQTELTEKEISWRNVVAKIWHRLLAEYLRMKLEQALDKADQDMFEIYDKYYSEFPRRRPMNEQEREECRCVFQRRNAVAQAYYGKKYSLNKWNKIGCVKDLKFDICPKNKGLDRNNDYKICLINNVEFCSEYEIGS
uniref:Bm4614 n=1 Tax=Brugia malayi TaxID=6279 RepID=A0A7I4KJL1_BRUMA